MGLTVLKQKFEPIVTHRRMKRTNDTCSVKHRSEMENLSLEDKQYTALGATGKPKATALHGCEIWGQRSRRRRRQHAATAGKPVATDPVSVAAINTISHVAPLMGRNAENVAGVITLPGCARHDGKPGATQGD